MTQDEQRALAIECGADTTIPANTKVIVTDTVIIFTPTQITTYTAAVEANYREKCAKWVDSLGGERAAYVAAGIRSLT